MADNTNFTPGTGGKFASDEVTYSGDTAVVGIGRIVHVSGTEGAKTVTELVRLEDAAHTSGDPGIPMLGVRQDTAISLAGTDGDYTMPIFDASGRQHVNVGTSALPTGASTSANQTTIIGHVDGIETSLTSVVTNTSDTASGISDVNTNLGILTETAPGTDTASSGLNGRLQRIAQRLTSLIALLPTSLGAGGGLKVDGSGTALPISDGSGSLTVDNNGTFAVQAASAGVAAHDAAVSGNPVLQGIEAHTVRPTAVADGDVVRLGGDVYSRMFAIKPRVTTTSSNGTAITTNTNTTAVAAPSAGSHLRVYRVFAQNSSATGTWVYWTEGSGGTKVVPMYLAQNQAMTMNLEGTWELATATALVVNTATTGANVEWMVQHETVID